MAQTAQIDILINAAQSAKTLGELDKALGDINKELKEIPIGSEAFTKLKTQADATSKTINNINISGFEKQVAGFEATSKTISSSLSLATGTMALFGAESEDTAKILAKVQGALAISTAFKDFTEAQKAADASGKGLNKTLLGNPFVLIAAVLLPLIVEMDEFKVILDLLGGAFKDIMKALKPLLDAFMMLLNSVLKAIIPIVKVFADILVKTLNPIMKVISKVLEGLNPLFETLGSFLADNTILVDAITISLQLALAPLTLMLQGLEALGVIDSASSLEATAEAAEVSAESFDNMTTAYDNFSAAQERVLTNIDKEIQLAEAQGKSEKEIAELRTRRFKTEQEQAQKRIAYLTNVANVYKLSSEQEKKLNEELKKAQDALADSQFRQQIADAEATTKRNEQRKKNAEDIKRRQADLEKGVLEINNLLRSINEEFVSSENVKFTGFFAELRQRYNDLLSKIPEDQKKYFQSFSDFIKKTFQGEDAFNKFVETYFDEKRFGDKADAVFLTITGFTTESAKKFEQLKKELEASGALTGAFKEFFDTFEEGVFKSNKVVAASAVTYDTILRTSLDPLQNNLENLEIFLQTQTLSEALEAFFGGEALVGELAGNFPLLTDVINKEIIRISEILETTDLQIVNRQRLEDQRKALEAFLTSYLKQINTITQEDIIANLEKPFDVLAVRLFDDVRRGYNEIGIAAIEAGDKASEVASAFGLPGALIPTEFEEYINQIRTNLEKLGVSADKVEDAFQRLGFRIRINYTNELLKEQQQISQRISLSGREREAALRKVAELRQVLIRQEIAETKRLVEAEIADFKKFTDARVAVGEITAEQGAADVAKQTEILLSKSSRIIQNFVDEADDEAKTESLRRLERFRQGTEFVITSIQSAAQSVFDILNNLSQQLLINLAATFEATVGQLEAAKEQGLLTQREFDFERLKAEEKYEKKRKQIEKEAWERQYAAQLFQAISGTALAVVNALAQFPGPPFTIPAAVVAGALGAAQVAVIATQPKPKFRRGGLVPGQAPGDSDTINAQISPGEFIVNAQAAKRFLPVLKQMNQFDRPTIGARETTASPTLTDIGSTDPVRAYVVLDELNEKNELLNRIQNNNTFFKTA